MPKTRNADQEITDSRLVQRLTPPFESDTKGDNPFAFGVGLLNGGLTKEAMNILRPIFNFGYMGAAEFEFGAVPEALNKIAKQGIKKQLVASTLEVAVKPESYWSKQKLSPRQVTFYIIQSKALEDVRHAQALIEDQTGPAKMHLKEYMRIPTAIFRQDSFYSTPIGWLELDNGFFIFVDCKAFKKTADLFGVKHNIPVPTSVVPSEQPAAKKPVRKSRRTARPPISNVEGPGS